MWAVKKHNICSWRPSVYHNKTLKCLPFCIMFVHSFYIMVWYISLWFQLSLQSLLDSYRVVYPSILILCSVILLLKNIYVIVVWFHFCNKNLNRAKIYTIVCRRSLNSLCIFFSFVSYTLLECIICNAMYVPHRRPFRSQYMLCV